MTIRKLATFAAVAIALAATPAFAAPSEGKTRVVRYADLNLATPAGVAALHRRVTAAVDAVCGVSMDAISQDESLQIDKCRMETRMQAEQRIADLLTANSRLASRR